MDPRFVDQDARDLAREAKSSLDVHREQVKGELGTINNKLDSLGESVQETKSFLKWFGGLLVTTILSVLAWSLIQQYSANSKAQQDVQDRVSLIQAQEHARAVAQPAPQQ